MLRAYFDRQLSQLNEEVFQLGSLARKLVADAIQSFVTRDAELANEVLGSDGRLSRLCHDLQQRCYALIATAQPVARDLRAIVAIVSMATDCERVGEHGQRIARISLRLLADPRPLPLADVPYLADRSLAMFEQALRALAEQNSELARDVCRNDDEVDALYRQTLNAVFDFLSERSWSVEAGMGVIQVAHELERVADRATNVAEKVIYVATGQLVDLNV